MFAAIAVPVAPKPDYWMKATYTTRQDKIYTLVVMRNMTTSELPFFVDTENCSVLFFPVKNFFSEE
jgi:hypothetical protein